MPCVSELLSNSRGTSPFTLYKKGTLVQERLHYQRWQLPHACCKRDLLSTLCQCLPHIATTPFPVTNCGTTYNNASTLSTSSIS
eukprot:1156208-Pelagomonas_calceolata.AAC.3